jgi:hypothetical protein
MGERSSEETVQTSSLETRGECIHRESLMPDLSKITKDKRFEEMVLMHGWLSIIKALPGTNSYF